MLRGVQLVYSKMFIFYKQFFPMVLGHSRLYRFFVLGCFLVLLFFQKRYCTITVRPIQAGSPIPDPNPILDDVVLLSEVGYVQQTEPLEGFPIPMPKMRRLRDSFI